MKIEFITKEIAYQKYLELQDLAWSIADANKVMPAECAAPECKLFMCFASLATDLKNTEFCIFIDDSPAEKLTESEITPGKYIIVKMVCQNVKEAAIKNRILQIKYFDGVVESYSFVQEFSVWKFLSKNISINVPSATPN